MMKGTSVLFVFHRLGAKISKHFTNSLLTIGMKFLFKLFFTPYVCFKLYIPFCSKNMLNVSW